MTKISIYKIDQDVQGNDKWIGSDAQNQYRTKNFTPTNLAYYFNTNQIIDIGTSVRYMYDTLDIGDTRQMGTLSFETEIGPVVNFSSISTFLLSKYALGNNNVSEYLTFLTGSNVIISKASDINVFGYFTIDSVEPYIVDPNFFVVNLSFISGNGFIKEDFDYLISLVDFGGGGGGGLFVGSYDSLVDLQAAYPTAENGSYAFINQMGPDLVYFFSTEENFWFQVPIRLENLTDVSLDGPSEGQVLSYNGTSERWENRTITLGTPTLQEVTDEGNETTNPLIYSGGTFVNQLGSDGISLLDFLSGNATVYNNQGIVNNGNGYCFPDNPLGVGYKILATLDDIITPTLQLVTDEGNTTTNDIQLLNDAEAIFGAGGGILLDNGSRLREGTIDAGYGGSKGIAQICAVGYELKWEAGRLYIMNGNGDTIREVRYTFTSTPAVTDDITKGFYVDSRWVLDNGDLYVCTDSTTGAAVWELQTIDLSGYVPFDGDPTDKFVSLNKISSNDVIIGNNSLDNETFIDVNYDSRFIKSIVTEPFDPSFSQILQTNNSYNISNQQFSSGLFSILFGGGQTKLGDDDNYFSTDVSLGIKGFTYNDINFAQINIPSGVIGFDTNTQSAYLGDNFDDNTGAVIKVLTSSSEININAEIITANGSSILPLVKNGSFSAKNEEQYIIVNGTCTVIDPTGYLGRGYKVYIRDGTAIIGGVTYGVGSLIYRYYYASVWTSTDFGASYTIPPLDDVLAAGNVSTHGAEIKFLNLTSVTGGRARINPDLISLANDPIYQLQDKPTGSYQLATLDDIPTVGGTVPHATASGTDTYTAAVTGVTAYTDGDAYLIQFTNGNTTGATLNINSIGAITLYRNNDGAVLGGDINAGGEMLCIYDNTVNGFRLIGTSPNSLYAYVTNADSVAITKGMPVYAFSGTGDRMTVKRAFNTSDATSAQTAGLVLSSSIAAGQKGLIMTQGLLDGLSILPTATWADGDPVYLGATAGTITNVKPYAPNHLVYLGVVTTASNGSAGRLYVRVQNGYELDELHNVQARTPTLKDTLWYDNTVTPAQWKTASIGTILGYTPAIRQIKLSSQTLTAASWTLVGLYYQYTFSNANIVTTGYVNFTPNNASALEVTTCKMLPQIDSNSGTCTFYSMFPPQNDIVGEIIIYIL